MSGLCIILLQESKYVVLPRHIPIMVKKKEDGPYWPHLMKQAKVSIKMLRKQW